jgi:hypothetical protein
MAGDSRKEKGAAMKCEEAGEFLSQLCDGQAIPHEAAEHIGGCEVCRARLNAYLGIGAELRRIASLEVKDQVKASDWKKVERARPNWWRKGWETMRIPRFVFALLLLAVVALGSGLVVVKARARNQGNKLLLTAKLASGQEMLCGFPMADEKPTYCKMFLRERSFEFRVLSRDGDRVLLGVRIGPAVAPDANPETAMNDIEEKQYWFEPGKELKIPVPGDGMMTVNGELTDYIPAMPLEADEPLDPKPGELRFVAPVLLRDNVVVQDYEGSVTATDKDQTIQFYAPGDALYRISLSPFGGAVEGIVKVGRVSFELNGHSYRFLLGAPATREAHVWVLRDPNYRPPSRLEHGFVGTGKAPSTEGSSVTKD